MESQPFKIQLSKESTILKGCFVKKLTLKGYFDVLNIIRVDHALNVNLDKLAKKYKVMSKTAFKKLYDSLVKHIKETRLELFKTALECNNKTLKYLDKALTHGYKTVYTNLKRQKQLIGLIEYLRLNLFDRLRARKHFAIKNTIPDVILKQIYTFNFNNTLKSKEDVKPEGKQRDAYVSILAALGGHFSKSDIDQLTLEQATELIEIIRISKVQDYMNTHFQGIRYSVLSQSSFKNDDNGNKRSKFIKEVLQGLVDQLKPKDEKPTKSKYMQALEREAIEVLKAKARKAGGN